MSYLLDTDFLSLFSKKRIPTAAERWFAGHEADCRISIVTWAELHFGVQAAAEADRPVLAA